MLKQRTGTWKNVLVRGPERLRCDIFICVVTLGQGSLGINIMKKELLFGKEGRSWAEWENWTWKDLWMDMKLQQNVFTPPFSCQFASLWSKQKNYFTIEQTESVRQTVCRKPQHCRHTASERNKPKKNVCMCTRVWGVWSIPIFRDACFMACVCVQSSWRLRSEFSACQTPNKVCYAYGAKQSADIIVTETLMYCGINRSKSLGLKKKKTKPEIMNKHLMMPFSLAL